MCTVVEETPATTYLTECKGQSAPYLRPRTTTGGRAEIWGVAGGRERPKAGAGPAGLLNKTVVMEIVNK